MVAALNAWVLYCLPFMYTIFLSYKNIIAMKEARSPGVQY